MPAKKTALVIRLSSLGDIVLSTAAIEPLRRAGFEICFVTKKAFAPLLEGHPELDEVFAFDKKGGERAGRLDFFRWCESKDFSVVIDLQDSWRTWAWRRTLSKRAKIFVARKERFREWLILFLRLGAFVGFGRGGGPVSFAEPRSMPSLPWANIQRWGERSPTFS